MPDRFFLLSPAYLGGRRGSLIMSSEGRSQLAARLRSPEGAALGEVYAFVSGLYFRGKLAYAMAFCRDSNRVAVITPTRGLMSPEFRVRIPDLEEFAEVDIAAGSATYREALERSVRAAAAEHGSAEFVLLGSIATGKYADILLEALGERLLFPREFVGRGDMSRGALMLRAAEAASELEYVRLRDAERRKRGSRGS